MKKILCPTDFSDTAHTAIAYAAKLAQATNCELVLLNVQSLFDLSVEEMVRGKQMTIEAAAAQLEAQAQQIARSFHISCYAEVEPAFRRLSSIIQEKSGQYDLIVAQPLCKSPEMQAYRFAGSGGGFQPGGRRRSQRTTGCFPEYL